MEKINSLQMVEKTKEVLPLLLSALSLKKDYTIDSVVYNEKILDITFPFGKEPLSLASFIPFAIHLGETIIKSVPGAKWSEEILENPMQLTLVVPQLYDGEIIEAYINPMERVYKYWVTDREYKLSTLHNTVLFLSKNDVVRDKTILESADKDGWFPIGGGDIVRVMKADIKKDININ